MAITNTESTEKVPIESSNMIPHAGTKRDNIESPASSSSVQLTRTVCLPSNEDGRIFLLLCANQSVLKLFEEKPTLLRDSINHSLDTTSSHQEMIVFVADGEIQEEFYMSSGNNGTPGRAQRMTASVSSRVRSLVDHALEDIRSSSPNSEAKLDRIRGVVHWDEVASSESFRQVLAEVEGIMGRDLSSAEETDEIKIARAIQQHVQTLVRNLFSLNGEKASKAGATVPKIFEEGEDSVEKLKKGSRYTKRYNHLQRACILELSLLLVGLEQKGDMFTEMVFPTISTQGMSYFADCLEGVRRTMAAPGSDAFQSLRETSTSSHGIAFAEVAL